MPTIYEYLRRIDPEYGNQGHQRAFLSRMERAEAAHPCKRDHSRDSPPIHTTACYPQTREGRMIGADPPPPLPMLNKPPKHGVGKP